MHLFSLRLMVLVATAALITALAAACPAESSSEAPAPDATAVADAGPDTAAPSYGPMAVTPPDTWEHDILLVPYSLHLSWQNDPATSVTFSWATTTTPVENYTSRVWLVPKSEVDADGGAMPWAKAWTHEGYGQLYHPIILGVEDPNEQYSSWHVEVTGLTPDTEYVYRVGTWESFDPISGTFKNATLSEPATFKTGLPKGTRTDFKVVFAGDSRGGYAKIAEQIDRLANIDARMWFFNGDMNDVGTQVEWDAWFQVMQPVLRTRVLMPVQGNHEATFANLYYTQYELPKMPTLAENMHEHAWSVDFANVHFVGLDSNGEDMIVQQLEWLDADLASAVADPDIDFIIAMMHHSSYSSSNHGQSPFVHEHFVPLFEKYSIDAVINGHDHNYERTVKIRQDAEADDGVTYVVAGGFFSKGYGNGNEWYTVTSHHGDKANYVVMDVSADTLSLTAYDGTGTEVLDQFELQKRER